MAKYASLIMLAIIVGIFIIRSSDTAILQNFGVNVADKYTEQYVRNIANSGANLALNTLTLDVTATGTYNNIALFNGTVSYKIERQEDEPSLGPTDIRVTSVGEFNNQKDTVVVLLTRPSFSRFAYFTNQEGSIWFVSDDTLQGPVHTNGYFNMSGSPMFYGKVTSHDKYSSYSPYRKYNSYTSPNFSGGSEWGVPELSMPTALPQEYIDAAQDSGFYINNRYVWMEFNSDGTVDIAAKNTSSWPYSWEYSNYNLSGTNGTIYVNYSYYNPLVYVEGTVNGQVTVGSKGYILINDDLVCADDPRTNPYSNDMIGLVATKDIVVYNNNYYTDRTIQATIMTLNTSSSSTDNFWVYYYNYYRYGTLHLYGGLIQNARGAVGTFSGGSISTGYDKNYVWDPRLKHMSPPNFPMLFVLKKISWWD